MSIHSKGTPEIFCEEAGVDNLGFVTCHLQVTQSADGVYTVLYVYLLATHAQRPLSMKGKNMQSRRLQKKIEHACSRFSYLNSQQEWQNGSQCGSHETCLCFEYYFGKTARNSSRQSPLITIFESMF